MVIKASQRYASVKCFRCSSCGFTVRNAIAVHLFSEDFKGFSLLRAHLGEKRVA